MDFSQTTPQACLETTQDQAQPLLGQLVYLVAGLAFGFILVKSEVVSWYRIQEMFRFQSFHMYGVIGSAVLVAMVSVWLIKRYRLRALGGSSITLGPKEPSYPRYILGGTLFGLGWAMTGACPGPIAALIGSGYGGFLVILASAIVGTWAYGTLRGRLPH